MHDLTQRQIQILKSIIEEYIETAEPIGSETLEKKHSISASPATIRNEMVKLTELGYLKKPHTSAGRVPTPSAIKFYVKQLMKEKDLSVADEVAVKEKLWDHRSQQEKFFRELTKSLADRTKTLAVATTEEGAFYCAGYANILDMPEFFDIDVTRSLLLAIDEFECFQELFTKVMGLSEEDVYVLVGEDLSPRLRGPYGFVFTHYETTKHGAGEVGIVGPTRLNYMKVVPMVRYYGDLIREIASGW